MFLTSTKSLTLLKSRLAILGVPLDLFAISIEDFSSISIEDINDSNVDARRMPIFLNNESIGEDVSITWTIDMRPAYYQILIGDTLFDIQGDYNVTNIDDSDFSSEFHFKKNKNVKLKMDNCFIFIMKMRM